MEYPVSPPIPPNDPLLRDRTVTRSLADRRDYLLIGFSLLVGAGAAALLCWPHRLGLKPLVELGDKGLILTVPIAVIPLVLATIFISTVLTPWRRRLELGWLRRLEFPFAHRGYLMALKRQTNVNDLQLLLTFEHAPDSKTVETLLKKRLPGSRLVWQDDHCVMARSPGGLEKKDTFGNTAVGGVSTNARLHRWFRRVAAPLLTDLHRKAGLKKVELRSE